MVKTILSWWLLGCLTGLIFIVALDVLAFAEIAPSRAIITQQGGILEPNWSDQQIVNAIYKAEGGDHATYPYGIRSISCESKEACRKICQNTIRNNRKRYLKNESFGSVDFIQFLGFRFCPTQGNSLSAREIKLNKNWISNVKWFLNHPSKA